jgi:hypothetical protein
MRYFEACETSHLLPQWLDSGPLLFSDPEHHGRLSSDVEETVSADRSRCTPELSASGGVYDSSLFSQKRLFVLRDVRVLASLRSILQTPAVKALPSNSALP